MIGEWEKGSLYIFVACFIRRGRAQIAVAAFLLLTEELTNRNLFVTLFTCNSHV